jgi:ornithine cyclodeaminase/alanine dehydrogenase-like protein (mu-crystallin family)
LSIPSSEDHPERFLGIMPAVAPEGMGAKLVCYFAKNAGSGVPTHLAMIMLFEPEAGHPLACSMGTPHQ